MISLRISFFILLISHGAIIAQVPDIPKVPTVDPNKNAEAAEKAASKADAAAKAADAAASAEKAAAAQPASEKAKAAQESAEKAEAAQKSAEKAEAAQKAAEKAEAAQKAASKAEVAQKAASKAETAQKAAEKAEVAQKAASKAETAQKAAEKAEVAQKAASKAETAQKAAEKAEVAQKAASKAETAQKAAEKAEVAQKAASKAEVAQKAAGKAETAQKAAEKAEVAQKAVGKAETAQKAAEKAEVAQKAVSKAETAEKSAEKAEVAQKVASKAETAQKAAEKADVAEKTVSKSDAAKKAVETAQRATVTLQSPVATSRKEVSPPTANVPAERLSAVSSSPLKGSIPGENSVSETISDKTPPGDRAIPANDGTSITVIAGEGQPVTAATPPPSSEKKPGFFESLFGGAKKNDSVLAEKAPASSPTSSKSGTDPETGAKVSDGSKDAPKTDASSAAAAGEGTRTFKAAKRDSEQKGGDRELKSGGDSQKDSKKSEKDQTPAQIVQAAVREQVREELISAGVSPVAAERLAGKIAVGEEEASGTARLIGAAAAALQLADASQAQIDKTLSEIAERRLTDASSGGTTDSIVGAEVIEAVTGRRLDPKIPRAGEVGRALLDAKAAIQLVGLDETTGQGKALIDEIFTKGLRGDAARGAIEKVVRPIVQEAEREQTGGGAPATSAAKVPVVDIPNNQTDIGIGRGPARVEPATQAAPVPVAEAPAAQPKRDVSTAIDFSDIDPNTPTDSVADSLVPGAPRPGSDQLPADKGSNPPKDNAPKDSPPPADPADKDKKSDGDGDASADASPTPPPKEEDEKAEDETPAPAAEEPPKDGTPNPMDDGGVNPLELAARTGGRLGGEQAKSQTRALDLILGGGGAGGPGNNPDSDGGSIILSPGEIAILSKTLSGRTLIKTVNGAVDPNPLEEGSVTITERDLKELHLKGNGGAKGPTENSPAPVPQDPNSPITGPMPVPGGGAPVRVPVDSSVSDQIKVKVKADVQQVR